MNRRRLLMAGGEDYVMFSSPTSFQLGVRGGVGGWDGTLEYSLNSSYWRTWDASTIGSGNVGGKHRIYLRGRNNSVITGSSAGGSDYGFYFPSGSDITVSGNTDALLDYVNAGRGQSPSIGASAFRALFASASTASASEKGALIDASGLVFKTISTDACRAAFQYNTSLLNPPQLPSTTVYSTCYQQMFNQCHSLLSSPDLPAEVMATDCYRSMFAYCESLLSAPALRSTSLAQGCYQLMFNRCSSIRRMAKLPALTLAANCYTGMYQYASSLKVSDTQDSTYQYEFRIPTTGTGINATDALTSMFASTGGTVTGAASINTTYYTDYEPV